MSLITKVIIDTKEYQHLKKIAAAYKVLVEKKELSGSGACHCTEKKEIPALSQIAAENDRDHSLAPPQKEIIPSITNPYAEASQSTDGWDDETLHFSPEERAEFEEAIVKKERWYYVGAWPKSNVRK